MGYYILRGIIRRWYRRGTRTSTWRKTLSNDEYCSACFTVRTVYVQDQLKRKQAHQRAKRKLKLWIFLSASFSGCASVRKKRRARICSNICDDSHSALVDAYVRAVPPKRGRRGGNLTLQESGLPNLPGPIRGSMRGK